MCVGLLQVYSSSFIFATESFGDSLLFFKKQLIYSGLAIFVLFFFALIPWKWLERWGLLIWLLSGICVALTLSPSFGHKVGGATRWIQLPF